MFIGIKPRKVAATRLGLRNPCLEKVGDVFYAAAPIDLSALPELPIDGNTFERASVSVISNNINTVQAAPQRRIMKQLLANRPNFYPGSRLPGKGDDKKLTECDGMNKDNGETVGEFTTNRVYLEQCLLTASYPSVRRIDGSYDKKRAKGSAPSVFAVMPGPMLKLAMKGDGASLSIRRYNGWSAFRTSTSEVVDNVLGWGDYYTRGASDEPDDPYLSMNYESMWSSNAPIVNVHPAHKMNPVGQYTFTKKADNRDVERDWSKGEGDFGREETYSMLRESIDYGSYNYTSSVGNFTAASNDDDEPENDDTPYKAYSHVLAAASAGMIEDAINITWRNFLISLFLDGVWLDVYVDNGNRQESTCISVRSLWFEGEGSKWSFSKLQQLKCGLQKGICPHTISGGEITDFDNVSLGGFGMYRYGVLSWEGDAKKGLSALSTPSSLHIYADSNSLVPIASGDAAATQQAFGWAQQALEQYTPHTMRGRARPLVGKASDSGTWEKVASGRFGTPANLYTANDPAHGCGAHLLWEPVRCPCYIGSSGQLVSLDSELVGYNVFSLAGWSVGLMSNVVTGFFEDEGGEDEKIERNVSDWDTGDSFFVWFWSSIPEVI